MTGTFQNGMKCSTNMTRSTVLTRDTRTKLNRSNMGRSDDW
jgi:hypothetical protein